MQNANTAANEQISVRTVFFLFFPCSKAFTARIADAQRNTTGTANIIKLNNIIIPPKNYQSIFNLTGS